MHPDIEAEFKKLFPYAEELGDDGQPVPNLQASGWMMGALFVESLADKYYGMWQRSEIEKERLRNK